MLSTMAPPLGGQSRNHHRSPEIRRMPLTRRDRPDIVFAVNGTGDITPSSRARVLNSSFATSGLPALPAASRWRRQRPQFHRFDRHGLPAEGMVPAPVQQQRSLHAAAHRPPGCGESLWAVPVHPRDADRGQQHRGRNETHQQRLLSTTTRCPAGIDGERLQRHFTEQR